NVVEKTWRYSRPDGSPDPRYKKDNVQIPVVLYTLLEIGTPSGVKTRLMVSSRQAAVRFATTFGAEDPRKTRREGEGAGWTSGAASGRSSSKAREESSGASYRTADILQREAQLTSARRTLGVAKGASIEQISAAYRKLARTHHPDKVANLEPKVRETSERRMKEINAAYALLKRQGGDTVSEGTG
ncbi:MAG TPA: J domain-containing protein, partial [Rubrobacter sp.]|nr:J domain-containing protein [Rubrobacter sp.]